ncbi:hypothetical protein NL676_012855 [Syzygium grande]|nr:hypothetical protein NL676_012855 [Syzygium grande]
MLSNRETIIWWDECMPHYSNVDFFEEILLRSVEDSVHKTSLKERRAHNGFQNESNEILYPLKHSSTIASTRTAPAAYLAYSSAGAFRRVLADPCAGNAAQTLPNRCPSNQEAIIWYNECMLHYLDADFFGVMATYPRVFMWNVQNNTSSNEPDVNALALIYNLVANVPYTAMMYGVLESDGGDGSQERYGLVQCSRDINSTQCSSCLAR